MGLWEAGPPLRLWGGLPSGEKGAVVSLVVRRGQWQRLAAEKFTRKGKRARGREKALTKKSRTMNSKGRWLAKFGSLASPKVKPSLDPLSSEAHSCTADRRALRAQPVKF